MVFDSITDRLELLLDQFFDIAKICSLCLWTYFFFFFFKQPDSDSCLENLEKRALFFLCTMQMDLVLSPLILLKIFYLGLHFETSKPVYLSIKLLEIIQQAFFPIASPDINIKKSVLIL